MNKVLWTVLAVAALIGGGLLFKAMFGRSHANNSDPLAPFEREAFERFEHENVQIYVPRLGENIPRFTGEIVEGRLFLQIAPNSGLQLEGVNTGCGCSVVRPVEDQNVPNGNQSIALAFSINTIGRIGPQDFPFTFRFRDPQGELKECQARVQFVLERAIEMPPVLDSVLLDEAAETFSQTLEIRSKIPDIQWHSVNVIVSGGQAKVTVNPRGQQDGFSVAEVLVSGPVANLSSGGLTLVFESPQFKSQPRTVIPFVKPGEQFIWKPESLEFRDPLSLPKLLIRANFECTAEELSLEIDCPEIDYQLKKVGKYFVVDFCASGPKSQTDRVAESGVIRLLHQDSVAAEIPFRWSQR